MMELEITRRELLREIVNTDSPELLETLRRAVQRFTKHAQQKQTIEDDCPYTQEELDMRIARSEADLAAGRVTSWQEMDKQMKQKNPWLCK